MTNCNNNRHWKRFKRENYIQAMRTQRYKNNQTKVLTNEKVINIKNSNLKRLNQTKGNRMILYI